MNSLDHLAVGLVFGAFQDEVLAPDQLAAADEEDLHAGLAVGARHGDHVRIHLVAGDHLLALDHPLDGLDLVAQGGGPLEAAALRRPASISCCRRADDRLGVALQEVAQVVDHLAVARLLDGANARPGAQLDVVDTGRGAGPCR